MKIKRIFGSPGCGKTTFLIKEIKELHKSGVSLSRIAFVSFTNKAIEEVVERCFKEFTDIGKEDLRNFKTIHSLGYREQNINRDDVLTNLDLQKIGNKAGVILSKFTSVDEPMGSTVGDKASQIESLSRLKIESIDKVHRDLRVIDCPIYIVKRWREELNNYKIMYNKVDFTDMISGDNLPLDVDHFIIDEAQDLSPLQWLFIKRSSSYASNIIIAGDDDQSIYKFAGAEVEDFLNFGKENKDFENIILKQSYRLPKKVFNLSKEILKRIKNRVDKEYHPTEKEGLITNILSIDNIDIKKDKSYLFLFRNVWLGKEIKEQLEKKGVPFYYFGKNQLDTKEVKAILSFERWRKGLGVSKGEWSKILLYSPSLKNVNRQSTITQVQKTFKWFQVMSKMKLETKFFIRDVLKNGYSLLKKPQIKISTIHQAKGGEADIVVLKTDISRAVWDQKDTESEARVWYVAITRTKEELIIVKEETNMFYNLPIK